METEKFLMVAKTLQGLEDILAEELRNLGAEQVEPGCRMVSFYGDKRMMYLANIACRTALRILKPFYTFYATDPDELYDKVKEYDWSQLLDQNLTFSISDTVSGTEFTNSRYATYRVKDGIVDWFKDKYGPNVRPNVRLVGADVQINLHISGDEVVLSLDSSGKSLHQRGYRMEQTDAPLSEVLAAGIILKSGWRGECDFVDPMCGSGTFLIEAALIATNTNPGLFRKEYAFEKWPDFDQELFEEICNDDTHEKEFNHKIYGADIDPKAIGITRKNIANAGVGRYIETYVRPIADWEEAPASEGVLVTNPPYGARLKVDDMEELYRTIGMKLKHVFRGWHAWILGFEDENFKYIGLSPSTKTPLLNGSLECELREYIIFEGDKKSFLASGGKLKNVKEEEDKKAPRSRKPFDRDARPERRSDRRPGDERRGPRRDDDRSERRGDRKAGGRDDFRGRDRDERRTERRSFGDGEGRKFSRDSQKTGEAIKRAFDKDDARWERKPFDRDARPERRSDRREDRDDRRGDREERRGERRSFDRDDRRGDRKLFGRDDRRGDHGRSQQEHSDNPLAKRRNENALRSITNKTPSIQPEEGGTIMRDRGWKKRPSLPPLPDKDAPERGSDNAE